MQRGAATHARRVRSDLEKALELATVVAVAAVALPRALSQGMFFDGLTYAAIARNLSLGFGTQWAPAWLGEGHPFFEHPPLMLWLEAIAFRIAGDHWYVEKICSAAVLVFTVLALRAAFRETRSSIGVWLPVLLFWVMPSSNWSAVNNMLDPLQALFGLLAVNSLLSGMREPSRLPLAVISGALWMVLALLTKGPVGFFPLATPALYALVMRNTPARRAVLATIGVLALVSAVLAVILVLQPEGKAFFHEYLTRQLFASLSGRRSGSTSHFNTAVLATILTELEFSALLAAIAVVAARVRTGTWVGLRPSREAVLFLAVGASASVPIVVSPDFVSYYLLPSYPFYALGIASWVAPSIRALFSFRSERPVRTIRIVNAILSGALVALGIHTVWHVGQIGRDASAFSAIAAVSEASGDATGVCASPALLVDWRLRAYLERYHRIWLESPGPRCAVYIAEPGVSAPPELAGRFEALATGDPNLGVFRRIETYPEASPTVR